jgi:multidrug efflux pump subunit AcrB
VENHIKPPDTRRRTLAWLALLIMRQGWLLPLAVILIVPMCVLAAMIGVTYRGLDRNFLVEIGLIVLVGLAPRTPFLSSRLPNRRRRKERRDLKPPCWLPAQGRAQFS